jgi:hypothetical protein
METQQILDMLKARQNKTEANRKADREALNEMSASMKSNQDLLAKLEARIETNKETDREERKAERKADVKNLKRTLKEMNSKMDGKQAEMRSTVCAVRSELEETIQHEMKDMLSYVDQKTQNLRKELTETIETTQMELQTVEVSLDKRTRDVKGKIAPIKEDITSNKPKFQCQLEEVKAVAERGSRKAVGTNAAQPPKFNGNTLWSAFRRQFKIVEEHNQWSDREKSTYLITALKGRAADVLPGIPTNPTYKDTL